MADWRYAPDLPPETPNIYAACDGFHPDIYGNYRTGWLGADIISTATGSGVKFGTGAAYKTVAGVGQAVLLYRDTSFANRKSYVYNAGWADREAANSGAGDCVVQVGNITLVGGDNATLGAIVSRDATGVANFAAVASSPKAGAMAVNAQNIVLALDTTSDGWATSDVSAPTLWTGGECASGNFRQTNGTNSGCAALGNDFIVVKKRGVFRGEYVGGTVKWVWRLIDSEKGAWGPNCVVAGGGKVYFVGGDGFYSYDGAGFERLDYGIWAFILSTYALSDPNTSLYLLTEHRLLWDSINQNVVLLKHSIYSFSSNGRSGAGVPLTYNAVSKKWGWQNTNGGDNTQDASVFFDVSALNDYNSTPPAGGFKYATNIGYFSNTDDKIRVLTTTFSSSNTGSTYIPQLKTSRIGTRGRMTKVTRVIPEWTKSNGVGTSLSGATVKTITPNTSDSPMETETAGTVVTMSTDLYRGDYTQSARFQSATIKINCEAVIAGVTIEAVDAGRD